MIVVYLCLSFFSNFGVPKWLPQAIWLTDVTEIVDACYIVQHHATLCYKKGDKMGEILQKTL